MYTDGPVQQSSPTVQSSSPVQSPGFTPSLFKQEINCVLRGFNKCPGVIFQKLECPGGILKFALLWGCIFTGIAQ